MEAACAKQEPPSRGARFQTVEKAIIEWQLFDRGGGGSGGGGQATSALPLVSVVERALSPSASRFCLASLSREGTELEVDLRFWWSKERATTLPSAIGKEEEGGGGGQWLSLCVPPSSSLLRFFSRFRLARAESTSAAHHPSNRMDD